jgi:hypothetical protein
MIEFYREQQKRYANEVQRRPFAVYMESRRMRRGSEQRAELKRTTDWYFEAKGYWKRKGRSRQGSRDLEER